MDIHTHLCPDCNTEWECRCGHDPCVIGAVCDECAFNRLGADEPDEAAEMASPTP